VEVLDQQNPASAGLVALEVNMIRAVEELAMNAWPSLQTCFTMVVLRFADGYTKRANSIHPLYPSSLSVEEKVQAVRRFIRARGWMSSSR